MKMPEILTYWTADEVAECLPISGALSSKLWDLLEDCSNPTPLGGDGSNGTVELPCGRLDLGNDDKAGHWWAKLTTTEQAEVTTALRKEGLVDDEDCALCGRRGATVYSSVAVYSRFPDGEWLCAEGSSTGPSDREAWACYYRAQSRGGRRD